MSDWFLTTAERDNPATRLDTRHPGEASWSEGNLARPLVHGATYFAELLARVQRMQRGDLLLFADWRGDPDQRLTDDAGSEVAQVFAAAADRGVDVRGLVWRSHWDRLAFSGAENRTLKDDVNRAGGQCVLDMRVRTGGSHHQKFVVLRHPGRPEQDVAFVGGIDLCHSRRDDARHEGDRQRQPMASVYGQRPPWHDIQLCLTGPVVGDVETVFRERWEDPQWTSRSPLRWADDELKGDRTRRTALPPQLPDPAPTGPHPVQLLRTYPRRAGGYPFAPRGERSVARGCRKAAARAQTLIYLEDQYLWSPDVARMLARALRRSPELRLVAVLPHFPDQDGRVSEPPNLEGRGRVLRRLEAVAPGRVAFYGIENAAGTPVYVHAKVVAVDDAWISVGSDNLNRRSWTHDSELTAAVCHEQFVQELRAELVREHLGLAATDAVPGPEGLFDAFATAADALQSWHDGGRRGPRPPGQVRPISDPPLGRWTRTWARVLYRYVYDPDGRPLSLRVRRGW